MTALQQSNLANLNTNFALSPSRDSDVSRSPAMLLRTLRLKDKICGLTAFCCYIVLVLAEKILQLSYWLRKAIF